MTKRFFALSIITGLLVANTTFAQRDTVSLNTDWKFLTDKKAEGMTAKWYNKPFSEPKTVTLPHTWNVEPDSETHYGWGWYQKTVKIPADWKNKNIILQFGAINHTSHIYINGIKVHENIGDGFNKFFVSLNNKLLYGKDNMITVAVNNDFGKNKVPYSNSFDWPNDGGLIRSVCFIVTPLSGIAYLHAIPKLNTNTNEGMLKLKLTHYQPTKQKFNYHVRITETNQPTTQVVFDQTVTAEIHGNEASMNIVLPKVNAWHFDFPNLYKIEVTALDRKNPFDRISTQTGFREAKFEAGKFYLNGEHVKLMGVEWTAGSNPNFGFAEPKEEIIRHGKLMKDVNCIFSRVHFQQDDVFFDFCDRNGILIQEEVPLWGGGTPVNDTIKSIAMRQLQSMIQNHYNHPSIIAWGVGNELRGRDAKMKIMIADLIKKAKELDPTRFVNYVSNSITDSYITSSKFTPDAASLGDCIMMNEYGGSWWNISVGNISKYLDSIHMSYPTMPFFISEFGLCEPNFKGGDQRRLEDLAYHMAIYESRPWIEGAIYFDLTDYRTHYGAGTGKFKQRVHGIYDMYGNPKPSMTLLRELSSPLEVQALHRWKKGKLTVEIIGSCGLPQHAAKGYKLYLSDKKDNYLQTKPYDLTEVKPGQKVHVEVEDLYDGKGIVTIVRPNGYVATQKSYYWDIKDL